MQIQAGRLSFPLLFWDYPTRLSVPLSGPVSFIMWQVSLLFVIFVRIWCQMSAAMLCWLRRQANVIGVVTQGIAHLNWQHLRKLRSYLMSLWSAGLAPEASRFFYFMLMLFSIHTMWEFPFCTLINTWTRMRSLSQTLQGLQILSTKISQLSCMTLVAWLYYLEGWRSFFGEIWGSAQVSGACNCRGIAMFRAIAGLARDESIAITGGSFFFLVSHTSGKSEHRWCYLTSISRLWVSEKTCLQDNVTHIASTGRCCLCLEAFCLHKVWSPAICCFCLWHCAEMFEAHQL